MNSKKSLLLFFMKNLWLCSVMPIISKIKGWAPLFSPALQVSQHMTGPPFYFSWIVILWWVPTETTPQACRDLQRAPQTCRVLNIPKDSMPFLCSLVWYLYLQGLWLWLTDIDDNRDFSFSPSLTLFLCLSEEWVLNRRCRGSWREEWVGVGWSWIGAYLIGCQTSWSFSISTKWDEPPSPQPPPQTHTRTHPWHPFKLM